MLITQKVIVKSSKYYKNVGYDTTSKYIEIDIIHLSPCSIIKVLAKCDYCDSEKEITYERYNRSIKLNKNFSCSKKCGVIKKEENNLNKYGVKSTNQLDYVKEKIKNTNLERYGVDNPLSSTYIRDKVKNTNLERYGVEHYSQSDEYIEKSKNTNLERYGVEHQMKSIEIKNKVKNTNLERYGVEFYLKSEEGIEKSKNTNLERYGVEHYSQSDEYIEKSKNTNLERYGVEHQMKSIEIKNKVKNTNLERYGVENYFQSSNYINSINSEYGVNNPMQSDSIKKLVKLTNIERYGVECVLQNNDIRERIIKTNITKYGYIFPTQNNEVKEKTRLTNLKKYRSINFTLNEEYRKDNYGISNNENYINYIGNRISLFHCDLGLEHTFEIHKDNYFSRIGIVSLCTVCIPIGAQRSIQELELLNYIKTIYSGTIISGYRDLFEIDIYLPDLKIGFEFNGLYWHSLKYKEKNYHLDKTNWFKKDNIRIVHIWEDDLLYKKDIIKSQIKNLINLTDSKIFARKCKVVEISNNNLIRNFLNENHIQGHVGSNIKIGLYNDDVLVSIMLFDHKEGRSIMLGNEWNLSRFCTKLNTNVVGGASKLLQYFILNYKPSRIISYADKSWSNGQLYEKLGFNLINESDPDYSYIIKDKRINKQNFTKYKLNKRGHDINKTEFEITNDILRIYDCGKMKFEKII